MTNKLTICRSTYATPEGFRNAVRDAVLLLLNNHYILTIVFSDEEMSTVSIQYDYSDKEIGQMYPIWTQKVLEDENNG